MIFIDYEIVCEENIMIANLQASKEEETACTRYLLGSSLRGAFLHKLIAKDPELFQQEKKTLLTRFYFLNGYPYINGKRLVPSIKGFYEDKAETTFESVMKDGTIAPGLKRASLGDFCTIEDETLQYYNVLTGHSMNIDVKQSNLFRNEYIKKGQRFQATIAIPADKENLVNDCMNLLTGAVIYLGNTRTAGYGKAVIQNVTKREKVLESFRPVSQGCKEAYLLLLSNMTMRDSKGEICGLDLEALKQKLKVKELKVKLCASSTVKINGVNRTWGLKTPELTMYEAGSIFLLTSDEAFDLEAMKQMEEEGIGCRREEGYGRVTWLESISFIKGKKALLSTTMNDQTVLSTKAEDREVLKIAARGIYDQWIKQAEERYITEHRLSVGQASKSQVGVILSMVGQLKYNPSRVKEIKQKFDHILEKENKERLQKATGSQKNLIIEVNKILEKSLVELLSLPQETVCGIPVNDFYSSEEMEKEKLSLIERIIKYKNREGKN